MSQLWGANTAPTGRKARKGKGVCRKCRKLERRLKTYGGMRVCEWCLARIIGLMARAGAVKGKPLTA